MEAIFIPELEVNIDEYIIEGEEFTHLKALRIRKSEKILAINGFGLAAECELLEIYKRSAKLFIIQFLPNYNESKKIIALALACLNSKERFEFAVEKAVELGVTHIIPILSKYSTKRPVPELRLRAKLIAALKQCKRCRLPELKEPIQLKDVFNKTKFENYILADELGKKPMDINGSKCIIIGPEGGFDKEELDFLITQNNIHQWKLGEARLRAETAAIAALSIASNL